MTVMNIFISIHTSRTFHKKSDLWDLQVLYKHHDTNGKVACSDWVQFFSQGMLATQGEWRSRFHDSDAVPGILSLCVLPEVGDLGPISDATALVH